MKTDDLVKTWMQATDHAARAKSEAIRAQVEAENAARALGKHLAPDDSIAPGEAIGIWVRIDSETERLVTVVKEATGDYRVSLRSRQPA
mgnify:CR=1 FL=1